MKMLEGGVVMVSIVCIYSAEHTFHSVRQFVCLFALISQELTPATGTRSILIDMCQMGF